MTKYAIWQRAECPFDFKTTEQFHGAEILHFGQKYICDGCDSEHYAGHRAAVFTYLIREGELKLQPLPASESARRALLTQAGIILEPTDKSESGRQAANE
jgi:hypothetical protein